MRHFRMPLRLLETFDREEIRFLRTVNDFGVLKKFVHSVYLDNVHQVCLRNFYFNHRFIVFYQSRVDLAVTPNPCLETISKEILKNRKMCSSPLKAKYNSDFTEITKSSLQKIPNMFKITERDDYKIYLHGEL